MVQISRRLQAVAALVTEHGTLADVGCDHGYIPIYLIQNQRIQAAIAMDVNPGPLERAKEHIFQFGLSDYISFRLSDGVQALKTGEADTVVIAGMGGGLVMKILEEGAEILASVKELILQPQSEIQRVREYLFTHDYQVVQEDMVEEDGKYYPMMRVVHGRKAMDRTYEEHLVQYRYGELLLAQKHPVLLQFLQKEQKQYEMIRGRLQQQPSTETIQKRVEELEEDYKMNQIALEWMCTETE